MMRLLLAPALLLLTTLAQLHGELTARTDFESGSAKILAIDQATQTIRFTPGGDPARGWPCWWYLRVDGAPAGSTINLELSASPLPIPQEGGNKGKPLSLAWASPNQAAFSTDGKAWQQTAPGDRTPERITYRVTSSGTPLWVAWGPPFTPKDTAALIERLGPESPWKTFTLATTRDGHPVTGLRLGGNAGRPVVWVQARQHAWESGGSWTGVGFAEWVAGSDPLAVWLREKAEIVFVPIMDVDHVLSGDGGKDALPQDHNRDWSTAPHWPEVAAAQERLRAYGREGRLQIFMDLHNPATRDPTFFFASPGDLLSTNAAALQHAFLATARAEFTGPLPFDAKPRESGASYHPLWRQISKNWVHAEVNPDAISLTLENAWNTPASTIDGYRRNGEHLGRTIAIHLQRTLPR